MVLVAGGLAAFNVYRKGKSQELVNLYKELYEAQKDKNEEIKLELIDVKEKLRRIEELYEELVKRFTVAPFKDISDSLEKMVKHFDERIDQTQKLVKTNKINLVNK